MTPRNLVALTSLLCGQATWKHSQLSPTDGILRLEVYSTALLGTRDSWLNGADSAQLNTKVKGRLEVEARFLGRADAGGDG